MKQYYIKCNTSENETLTLNLKYKTLFEIDSYTLPYESESEIKEDFIIACPNVRKSFIENGIVYIEKDNREFMNIIYNSEAFTEMHKYIKVNEETDQIEDTMTLRQYIVSLFMRFGEDNINYLTESGLLNVVTLENIKSFKDASLKSQKLRELKSQKDALDYYYLRDFVETLNKHLSKENKSKTI